MTHAVTCKLQDRKEILIIGFCASAPAPDCKSVTQAARIPMIIAFTRTLIKREPTNIMHVVALAEVMGKREGPVAAAAVYEFAVDQFPDFALLRVSLAVELIKAGQVEDAKRVLKVAIQQDPQLRAVILDHPGLEEISR